MPQDLIAAYRQEEERYRGYLRGDVPDGSQGQYIHMDALQKEIKKRYLECIPRLGIWHFDVLRQLQLQIFGAILIFSEPNYHSARHGRRVGEGLRSYREAPCGSAHTYGPGRDSPARQVIPGRPQVPSGAPGRAIVHCWWY